MQPFRPKDVCYKRIWQMSSEMEHKKWIVSFNTHNPFL
jgi:hypothetical protein